ncbi:MAG: glycosyltransferase [Blastocatellia bacterium]
MEAIEQSSPGDETIEVTIIIPTRDRQRDLERCLAALAEQTYPLDRVEILVCDDGSREPLAGMIGDFRARGVPVEHLRQAPAGPAAARNLGIRHARGSIVAMTDSDTLPQRDWLAKLVESLAAHPTAVGVEGQVYANNEGAYDPLGEGPTNRSGGVYLTCNCAYRRSVLLAIGGFDQSFPYPAYEDVDLAASAQAWGPIVWQPEAVVLHPQRPLTWRNVLQKLHHWEYVLLMGFRYGYLGWPRYPVRHPRGRVALLAVVALPLAKWKTALGWLRRRPGAALTLCGLGVLECLGALLIVVPRALFGRFADRIPRKRYLS